MLPNPSPRLITFFLSYLRKSAELSVEAKQNNLRLLTEHYFYKCYQKGSLQKVYRGLVLRIHPDKLGNPPSKDIQEILQVYHSSREALFRMVHAAYEKIKGGNLPQGTLSDPSDIEDYKTVLVDTYHRQSQLPSWMLMGNYFNIFMPSLNPVKMVHELKKYEEYFAHLKMEQEWIKETLKKPWFRTPVSSLENKILSRVLSVYTLLLGGVTINFKVGIVILMGVELTTLGLMTFVRVLSTFLGVLWQFLGALGGTFVSMVVASMLGYLLGSWAKFSEKVPLVGGGFVNMGFFVPFLTMIGGFVLVNLGSPFFLVFSLISVVFFRDIPYYLQMLSFQLVKLLKSCSTDHPLKQDKHFLSYAQEYLKNCKVIEEGEDWQDQQILDYLNQHDTNFMDIFKQYKEKNHLDLPLPIKERIDSLPEEKAIRHQFLRYLLVIRLMFVRPWVTSEDRSLLKKLKRIGQHLLLDILAVFTAILGITTNLLAIAYFSLFGLANITFLTILHAPFLVPRTYKELYRWGVSAIAHLLLYIGTQLRPAYRFFRGQEHQQQHTQPHPPKPSTDTSQTEYKPVQFFAPPETSQCSEGAVLSSYANKLNSVPNQDKYAGVSRKTNLCSL